MDNQAVLEKAIRLAIDGGWDFFGKIGLGKGDSIWFDSPLFNAWDVRKGQVSYDSSVPKTLGDSNIIFNHKFAKALWGEEEKEMWIDSTDMSMEKWQYHLQQMVIADDPIKYLGENL